MKARIILLPGDGIGPEVMAEARKVLETIAHIGGHAFELHEAPIGGAAIDTVGVPLPDTTLSHCQDADAVLLGAVGGPKWSAPGANVRPEQGLLGLRKGLKLFANLRPIKVHPKLASVSPLRPELLEGVDLMVVRELIGGIYFGQKSREGDLARDVCEYSLAEVQRVVRVACNIALGRRGKVTSVDKANVLETSRLWREGVTSLMRDEFPSLQLEHILVDAAAMHLLQHPADYDVVVTENMFGDILTDEASMLVGSVGMVPSASLGEGSCGLYEPIHGSAPDIAGMGIANPYAMILSVAMALRHSLRLDAEAAATEAAVSQCIDAGVVTPDLVPHGTTSIRTVAVGDAVVKRLRAA